MKLYHGTSAKNIPSILSNGILPRGKRKGNWKHTVDSHKDCVYLTDTYAVFFAMTSVKPDEKCAIIEIETEHLDFFGLLPDEDTLEQATRGFDDIQGNMIQRTKKYRSMLKNYSGTGAWMQSLEMLGNCCYLGIVPPRAITRIATLSTRMLGFACDPSISIINQRIMGDYYKAMTAKIFGDPIDQFFKMLGHSKEFLELWVPEDCLVLNIYPE